MRKLIGVALVLTASALPAQSKLGKPVIDTVNHHTVRVMNSGPTAWADTNGWKLVYERTVQPPDGSPGELSKPWDILLLGDGRLIESEQSPASVRLFDATGHFVRALGRDGEGPGEYRSPFPVLFHDTVVIHDPKLARTTLMTLDGKVLRSFRSVCCTIIGGSIDTRGRLRVQTSTAIEGEVKSVWLYMTLDGTRVDSFLPPKAIPDRGWTIQQTFPGGGRGSTTYGIPLAPWNAYAHLSDGSILYGGTDRYELLISRDGRDTTRIFGRRDVAAKPASRALRDSLFHGLVDKNDRAKSVAVAADIPATYPIWSAVAEDGAGNLWLTRGGAFGLPRQLDVFSADGRFLGEVPLPFTKGRIAAWSKDHVAVSDVDENELPRIRIFRIDRRGH